MFDVSIIIVHHYSRGLVRNCLRSVASDIAHNGLRCDIVVVHSGPDPDTSALLAEEFPGVREITKPNTGYSSAINAAIKSTAAHYYFILNPDVVLLSGKVVRRFFDFMENNPTIGLAVPKLLNPDGSIQLSPRRFPRFSIPLYSRTIAGALPFAKHAMRNFLMVEWDHEGQRDVDWALGSAMFTRGTAIADVGLMDEHYFLYVEDTDWCRSFWENGWRVTYVGMIDVVHYHTRSSATQRGLRGILNPLARAHIRSWFYYFRKFRRQSPSPREQYHQQKTTA